MAYFGARANDATDAFSVRVRVSRLTAGCITTDGSLSLSRLLSNTLPYTRGDSHLLAHMCFSRRRCFGVSLVRTRGTSHLGSQKMAHWQPTTMKQAGREERERERASYDTVHFIVPCRLSVDVWAMIRTRG